MIHMFVNLYSRLDRMYTLLHNCFFFDMRDMLRKLQTSRNCNTAYGRVSRVSHVGTQKKQSLWESDSFPMFQWWAPSPMTQNCIPLRRHLPKQLREHPAWPTRRRWPVRWTIACHSPLWKGKNVIVLPCHFPTIVFQVFFKATLLCFHFLYPLVN